MRATPPGRRAHREDPAAIAASPKLPRPALPGRRRAPAEEAATRRRLKTRQPLPRCRQDPAGAVPVVLTATGAA
ncbi:hypothetical protein SHIRM173S_09369 [Streptomyces hirsutus]